MARGIVLPLLRDANVAACLNQVCCKHDLCYGTNCVASGCEWTNQSLSCDEAFMAVTAKCCNSALLNPLSNDLTVAICTIAECLYGGRNFLERYQCKPLRSYRLNLVSTCKQPACAVGLSCCDKTCVNLQSSRGNCGACGQLCATAGDSCVNGTCKCGGRKACVTGASCSGGTCCLALGADCSASAPELPCCSGPNVSCGNQPSGPPLCCVVDPKSQKCMP